MREVVCYNYKLKGHYANKCPAKKLIPGDITTKWCSLQKTRSHSDNECMAQHAIHQSASKVSALPTTYESYLPYHIGVFIYLRGKLVVSVH